MTGIQLTLALLVAATTVITEDSKPTHELKWQKHYDLAKEVAQATERPLVVVLENPGKKTEKIDETKLTSPDRQKIAQAHFELVRVDVNTDYGKRVAAAFGAKKFPYTATTDARSERIVFRKAGPMSEKDWTLALAKSLKTVKTTSPSVFAQKPVVEQPVVEQPVVEQPVVQATEVQWLYDFGQALEKSSLSQKPMFVYFTAPGCTYCEIMKNEALIQLPLIHDLNNRFVPVQINAREQRAIADQFQVRVYPTIAVVRANGQMIETWNGYKGLPDFRARIKSIKARLAGTLGKVLRSEVR